MYKLMLAGGTALLMAACASAPTTGPKTAVATQQEAVAVTRGTPETGKDQLICTDSYPLGSHIPQRICLTKEQMAARQKAAQEAMRNSQLQGRPGSCNPACI
ncbi:MAG: hypothetical protein ACRESQ_04840 [Gammaproteobacteria bacterium]